jgi:hypothetical protein
MCAVVRLRALMARKAARLITNPPIVWRANSDLLLKKLKVVFFKLGE